ncbi:MAG: DegT/DnrJ/EryC1/StrS family aminotransferase [Bacteriovoracaceae bacterium]|nr:DegT/DnrJ/EryC1/StrS family aminotransferase [Bacteriovoracaceae bacterium]
MIPIFEPMLGEKEREYLLDCIDTGWISSQGEYIHKFEEKFAEFHNMKFAISVSNCTAALHLSLVSNDIGEGDEVICPALTFISPANMVVLSGAKLILVDVEADTMNLDPALIEAAVTPKTKAIIIVHQFGHAAAMDEILEIAKKYNLIVIEDNAEALGGKYKGQMLGTLGDVSCFSFFANKILTTGEGGMILSNDSELATRIRTLRDHGMSAEKKYPYKEIGYNYRMTNMQAAIGVAQLEKLNDTLNIRNDQMDLYYKLLADVDSLNLRKFKNWTSPVHWLLTIQLKSMNREKFIEVMSSNGIECRPMIFPVYHGKHFRELFSPENFPAAEAIYKSSVHLPSSTKLTNNEIEMISNTVKKVLAE